MFFKRKRRIKELEEQVIYLQKLSNSYMDDLKTCYKDAEVYEEVIDNNKKKFKSLEKDYNKLLDKHNEVTKKYNALKAEVSRLNKAKNRLVKDKDSCKAKIKSITKNKKYYNHRDSKGRFTKKKK
ncbi:MAG: hypothetical protein ACRC9P_10095 [Bacteroides sp.]